jgi:hypothetical protein
MEDFVFSDEFCRFIQLTVPSVEAAELLLILREHSDRWWSAGDAASVLSPSTRLGEADWARLIELWQARGLVAVGPDKRAQFRPGSPELAAHADKLAHAYSERPVTLIHMIYALRDVRVRSFADAFKLGKN